MIGKDQDAAKRTLVQYWLEKSTESLCVAKANLAMESMTSTVNRLYYAAFYAMSALLAAKGLKYGKHSAVQSALHRDFVKTGLLSRALGVVYDELIEARHEGDYAAFVTFERDQVQVMMDRTEAFLTEVHQLAALSLKEPPSE
jgi:hypothetical protein